MGLKNVKDYTEPDRFCMCKPRELYGFEWKQRRQRDYVESRNLPQHLPTLRIVPSRRWYGLFADDLSRCATARRRDQGSGAFATNATMGRGQRIWRLS